MAKKKKSPKFVEAIKQNKVVRNTVLGITATVGVGALYSVFSGDKSPQSLDEQQAQELREMHKNEMHRVDSLLNRKYKITDRASFDQLYRDALPLIQLSMFSTEVLVKEAYADAKGRPANTKGLGSYYVPVNGNPKSSEWELTALPGRLSFVRVLAAFLLWCLCSGGLQNLRQRKKHGCSRQSCSEKYRLSQYRAFCSRVLSQQGIL